MTTDSLVRPPARVGLSRIVAAWLIGALMTSMAPSGLAQIRQMGTAVLLLDTPAPVSGRDPNSVNLILPADVLSRANLVRDELELIRRYMGKPVNDRAPFVVFNARPQEVYFQALTLHRKADRLAFEQTRTLDEVPAPLHGEVKPAHVYRVLDRALVRILQVKAALGISTSTVEVASPESTMPTQVFTAIVDVNRQLNLMLTKAFSPSDVYQQVTRAVHFTNTLLGEFDVHSEDLATPTFEPGKVPLDVYRYLLRCLDQLRGIARVSGVVVLDFPEGARNPKSVTPSDVYDIASLVVSELSYMYGTLDTHRVPAEAFHPGIKFPSHVYQRVGILAGQLGALRTHVDANPAWLGE